MNDVTDLEIFTVTKTIAISSDGLKSGEICTPHSKRVSYNFLIKFHSDRNYLIPFFSGEKSNDSNKNKTNRHAHAHVDFRGCHRPGTHRSCIRDGGYEDHWKTQEHYQFDRSLHSRRLVDRVNIS